MFAAHCDLLVLGVGASAPLAYADAEAHGAEAEGLDVLPITGPAARYVQAGGDCRGLELRMTPEGDDYFDLRDRAPPAPHFLNRPPFKTI